MTQIQKWNTADTITSLRIVLSISLLFLPVRSAIFLAVYTLTGLTDVVDGLLARQLGIASEFGARLDSMADMLFYGVLLLRLFPVLWQLLPTAIWYVIIVIVLVRLVAYATAAVRYHRFAALHTLLNKLTGGAVFLLPYVLMRTSGVTYSWMVCILAFFASVEELAINISQKEYQADRKTIFRIEVGGRK